MNKKQFKQHMKQFKMHKFINYTKTEMMTFIMEDMKKFSYHIDSKTGLYHVLVCNEFNCYCFEIVFKDEKIIDYVISDVIPKCFIESI
jgi:hypothetical protein